MIDRRSGLSHREFVEEYRNPGKPVILTDLSKAWSASSAFTFEFFEQKFGNRPIEVNDTVYQLREVLNLLKTSTQDNPAPYPIKLNLQAEFADLKSYVTPRPGLANPDRTHHPLLPQRLLGGLHDLEVFFGGPGGEFPYLHYDYLGLYAFINQLYGEKEFTIFPPEQQAYLYPKTGASWLSEIADHHNPDLNQYPLFAQATPIKAVVSAGESLFIPCGWYHTARSLTLTISVAFDQLCESNWNFFINECIQVQQHSSFKAKLITGYLKTLGKLMTAYEKIMRID